MFKSLAVVLLVLFSAQAAGSDVALESVLKWNNVAIDASGFDHAQAAKEQPGPGRSSRAIAIVQVAVFEALNSINGGYESYVGLDKAGVGPSRRAAVAQAARDTLVKMFPAQRATFDAALKVDLDNVPNDKVRADGVKVGKAAASAILAKRKGDGSNHPEPVMYVDYFPKKGPGQWDMDPVSQIPVALGAEWGHVKPFVLKSGKQFRVPPPPAMTSKEYAEAYEEVKRLGGDGITTNTERTAQQTFIGIYWAYDGTPSLCAPPRLYNQILQTIALQRGSSGFQTARLLALANIAMADAGIAIWESKYYYHFWRPVLGIRKAGSDGNPETERDSVFAPLGAPASNLTGPNFTPPFPAYPSGHAGFGGALFQVLRRFYGTDDVAFTFVSDEFNGETLDNEGNVRKLRPRRFRNFSQAEEENGQSRIYLGIHWTFDKSEGITQGQQIGDYVVDRLFLPARP